jgi:hypothetical protein
VQKTRLKLKRRGKEMTIAHEVIKFFVSNSEIHEGGQGVVSVTSNRLWEMPDEEFIKLFLKQEQGEQK